MAEESVKQDLAVAGDAAAVPATVDDTLDSQNLDINETSSSKMEGLLGDLDIVRQIILVLSVAICVALIVMLFFWIKTPEMRPLGTYETEELIPVLDYLDQQKIEYSIDGNTIRVPVDQYASLQLNLTRAGLNTRTQAGDDILLNDMGFGVSQRLEQERLKLSRERQLARAIEQIRQVSKAQVLLAMPKQSVFVRHNQDASATVFLTLRTGATLGQEEVDSIVDMVATAVPGLTPARVTVTDQHGRLLSSGTQDATAMARRKEYEMVRKQEANLRDKIDSILIPVLGLGNYTAQVDVSMDFSAVEETRKRFDPETPATRSEFTLEDINNGSRVAGIPGALSNQPPVDSSIPQDVIDMQNGTGTGGSVHREATRNFELDTTISHRRGQTGVIDRQTVSVAVNYRPEVNAETGEMSMVPRTEAELENIRRLLMGGVGFSDMRGDMIEVISVPFVSPEMDQIGDVPIWDHPNFNNWIRWLAAALVMIVVVLVLIRPAMRKLLYPNVAEDGTPLGPDGLPLPQDNEISLLGSDIDGIEGFEFSSSSIDLPNLHKDEDLLKAVRALVANEPDLAVQVVKSWVTNDG
ncbi:flagellar basal-body MS-ring/collar protein FliF [Thaumasiovibrio subtropicus]|uniref:flagellar basal-body MS-ring/collar protein FliF n=1 Tax=Thaumasiovibrio subtropicus TaxID=1891207 RepID=UPI000B3648BF|nr:flagellar basal-body MS-ring/collar protein FliF [Thaumasiovibrio subtropicus]